MTAKEKIINALEYVASGFEKGKLEDTFYNRNNETYHLHAALELVKNCTILDVSQCSEKNNEYENLRAKSDCCNSDMDLHWKDGTICKKCGKDCNYHTVDITKEKEQNG